MQSSALPGPTSSEQRAPVGPGGHWRGGQIGTHGTISWASRVVRVDDERLPALADEDTDIRWA
ncbi:MAG: hypothetical protein JF598_00805 [Streptomyces sp.]|nr:hypothetical protein [Streptomyces sp.]